MGNAKDDYSSAQASIEAGDTSPAAKTRFISAAQRLIQDGQLTPEAARRDWCDARENAAHDELDAAVESAVGEILRERGY